MTDKQEKAIPRAVGKRLQMAAARKGGPHGLRGGRGGARRTQLRSPQQLPP